MTRALRAQAKRMITPAMVERAIREVVSKELTLVKASTAAKLMNMGLGEFKALKLPVAVLGEKTRRYELSMIRKRIEKVTVTS